MMDAMRSDQMREYCVFVCVLCAVHGVLKKLIIKI